MSSDHNFTDVAFGREHAKLLIKAPSDTAVARDAYKSTSELRTISAGDSATVEHEFFTLSYPVSLTPIQDLENAYLQAYRQLSTLKHGRYAYARDWNVLADYAKAIINALVYQLNKLVIMGNKRYIYAYGMLLECQRILSTYKYLRSGDVIMPEHTNTLIDVVWCLDLATRLLFARAVTRRREKDTTKGLEQITCSRSEVDVTRGLDQITYLRKRRCVFVLVNTDDWETAKKYVTNGTIIFVNYGTQAITPDEVRNIVNTMNVVFAVLINHQPALAMDAGAFYDVFYIKRNPFSLEDSYFCVTIVDDTFKRQYGIYGCYYPICGRLWQLPTTRDFLTKDKDKIESAKPWGRRSDLEGYSFAYAKYNAGGIIELPYDGTFEDVEDMNIYVAMVANRILGEPNSCYISERGEVFRRMIWMASYKPDTQSHYADVIIKGLASRSGCYVLDLR